MVSHVQYLLYFYWLRTDKRDTRMHMFWKIPNTTVITAENNSYTVPAEKSVLS